MAASDLLVEVGDPGSATTLASNYTAGDTSVTVASTANWPTTGKAVVFAIDNAEVVNGVEKQIAGTYNEFEGTVASATSVTNVDWKRGAGDTNYDAGSLTRVYIPVSAERENRIVTWGTAEHNQDGTHSDVTATSVTATTGTFTNLTISGTANDGWTATGGTHSVSTGYNSGNRSFLIDTSTDLSGIVSEGMRYRVTRGTTPPTQCADLEASSSQYASKSSPTGITFTDDFTCEAWVKLESYTSLNSILTRFDGSNGWAFDILTTGELRIVGDNAGADYAQTYQSVPLGRWVHVAASMNISASTATLYIDGVEVPNVYTNGTSTGTSQVGDLQVGARTGGSFFDGKIADVRVWSDIRTATEIRDNMYNYPSDTTGLVAHFKLNGDFTDASSNGNDLTAQNSATATDGDNPWNATEYGVITAVTSSTIQVFCPEGYGIPNETLTAPFYSTQDSPFGFPRDKGKWVLENIYAQELSQTSTQNTPNEITGAEIIIPVGAWILGMQGYSVQTNSSSGQYAPYLALSTSDSSFTNNKLVSSDVSRVSSTSAQRFLVNVEDDIILESQTKYYVDYTHGTGGGTVTVGLYAATGGYSPFFVVRAKCAYI